MTLITSTKNEQFKLLKSLLTSKGIKKNSLCLVMGRKQSLPRSNIELQVLPKDWKETPTDTNYIFLTKELFNRIDILGTHHPISVIKTPKLPKWNEQDKLEGKEVLIPLKDPANLGNIIRTCVAFDMDKIILLHGATNPFLPKVIKTSNYAVFSKKMFLGPKAEDIKSYIALNSNKGIDIKNFKWPQKGRLMIGEERGIIANKFTSKQPDQVKHVNIPMVEGFDSLNASVAASIAMYNWKNS